MSGQKIENIALPHFTDDLGSFVSRLRSRLFPTQSKAARYFGLKSHGTISRYESEILRPPLGYIANLIRLYVEKLEQEGQPLGTGQTHFLREANRVVRRHYSWDEAPFHNWESLCVVADEFMAGRSTTNGKNGQEDAFNEASMLDVTNEAQVKNLQTFLTEFVGVQTFAFLFADADKRRDLRNRQTLLKLVHDFWIDGVLENSLYNSVFIELGLQVKQEAITYPWELYLKVPQQQEQPLETDTKIIDVYHQMGQSLLILGEPGAGKTTMLLTLARDLIKQAEQNPLLPIPVIFNLSSWVGQPLAEWFIEELQLKYKIPRRISRLWVEHDALLPLLDGLDEVALAQRDDCVQAINLFHQEYLVPLVVCSRVSDYEALVNRLTLRGAVVLQSLTTAQIETYLNLLGPELNHLQHQLQEDVWLQELAQTPLMLNIITLVYSKSTSNHIQQLDTPQARQKYLFDTYIDRMYARKNTENTLYSDESTTLWLGWLAGQMYKHNQSIFLIEQIQPTWLGSERWTWLYLLISRMGSMLPGGILIGLVAGISGVPLFGLENTLLNQPGNWLLFGLLLGAINGLMLVAFDGIRFKTSHRSFLPNIPIWLKSLIVGILFGLIDVLVFWYWGGIMFGLIGGLTMGLIYGLTIEIRGNRNNFLTEIQPVEALQWSWRNAFLGGVFGVVLGLFTGAIAGWIVGLDGALLQRWSTGPLMRWAGPDQIVIMGAIFGACLLGFVGIIFQGMRGQVTEAKAIPNQGIWLSLRYALLSWLGLGLIIGIAGGLLFGLFSGFQYSWQAGIAFFICFGSLASLWYGGLELIQHYTIRILLWLQGYTPRHYIQFLDHATDHILLRRVGGGYVFIHRLLLEHFAKIIPKS